MQRNIHKILLLSTALIIFFSATAIAEDVTASLAQMPVYAESMDKGVLVDLVKAIQKQSGETIIYQVVPFKRSMSDVITGKVDFHMPLIQNPDLDEAALDYDHAAATIFHVNFVLYTHKGKPVDKSNIANYKIETDAAHVSYFHGGIIPSTNIESSLKKVNAGRIDGLIFADMACDPVVKNLNLSNIKRELYKVFDVKVILPKGKRGQAVDNMLTTAIDALQKSGEYQKIMGIIDAPYNDWQP
jgi:ABC-type amino acid transport substrate-binding protein